ncbi:hypothetical protein HBI56_208610 [Parastagonospora nodorum]|nr:hypothetical protein HBH51_207450 [Parastagonospora nodorum]KAH3961166.1 hypothetical protein HBH52_231950 [Parastagonospora nodorum]KAH4058784.1 hypothetical protein HBH50_231280 [Parastagonospora nodorum]KAH4078880.1 hypothetical protein HBH48_224750 [Parastagonospora nodorum]KAH4401215.1 hypothetical protein HBH92_228760 [Parastagonospora nodorum]
MCPHNETCIKSRNRMSMMNLEMASANLKPTSLYNHETSEPVQEVSYNMRRFLSDRQDEHLMHEHTPSQDCSRREVLQRVMDKVDKLVVDGKEINSQQKK